MLNLGGTTEKALFRPICYRRKRAFIIFRRIYIYISGGNLNGKKAYCRQDWQ